MAASASGGGGASSDGPQANILVCGTPGTGKTTLATALAERIGFNYINIGDIIKEKGYHAGRDEEFDTLIFDEDAEDKLLDDLEPLMATGGNVVDFHTVDFFPERFFDLVLVLRADNTILYDRLFARGYSAKKIEENVTAEIMCVVVDEAKLCYREELVQEVSNNTMEDMEATMERVEGWLHQWRIDNPEGVDHSTPGTGGAAAMEEV